MTNKAPVYYDVTLGKLMYDDDGTPAEITTGGTFSGDAGDVPYTIPLTGGDATTVEARLSQVISVKDFGAMGDGTTDDTQAFKDALVAAKDYTNIKQLCVFVPAGQYKITDTLALDSNVMLFGAGHYASRLLGSGTTLQNKGVLWTGSGASDTRYNCVIQNLQISNTATDGIGIFLENAYDYRVDNVIVNDASIGVKIYGGSATGSYYNVLRSVVCGACTTGFLIDSAVTGSNVNENSFYDCRSHNATYPFQIKSGNNNRFYSPTAETTTAPTYFFQIFSGVEDTLIIAPRCETAGTAAGTGIKLDSGSTGTVLIGGHYSNISTALSDSGTNTTTVFNGTISGGGGGGATGHRYWRSVKTNSSGTGSYINEMEVYVGATKQTVTAGMLSQSGLGSFSAANLIDGNTSVSSQGFHLDSSGIGDYLEIDFGSGNNIALNKWRLYAQGSMVGIFDIKYSDDGTTYATAATGFDVSGGAGWKEKTW